MSDVLLFVFDGIIAIPLVTVLLVQLIKPHRSRYDLDSQSPGTYGQILPQTLLENAQERYARGEIELAELEETIELVLRSQHTSQYW